VHVPIDTPIGEASAFAQVPAGYLDALGGTPMLPAAVAARRAAENLAWADPARLHHAGRTAGLVLDSARASIAAFLGVRPGEVHLTSSIRAALEFGLTGVLAARPTGAVALSAVESLALFEAADRSGRGVEVLPVDSHGCLRMGSVPAAPTWAVACLQAANPEVGTRQPVETLSGLLTPFGIPVLVDATACPARIPLPSGWSALALSARDWGGPAGVGVLVIRQGTSWVSPPGSDRGWLGGFPDIASAAAAGIAAETIEPIWRSEASRAFALIARIRAGLTETIDDIDIVGDHQDRLPHVLTFSALYCSGEAVVSELDRRGIAVASGSACVSDTERPSHVLAAMGALTGGNVRLSLPFGCTDETVDDFLQQIPEVIQAVRADAGI
jgi:cysteine desulfurase